MVDRVNTVKTAKLTGTKSCKSLAKKAERHYSKKILLTKVAP